MTKSTKIIAALGVAAGLGIAALPAGSIFAADLIPFDYTTATSTGKDVTVKLTVGEAIAIAVEKSECDAGTAQVKSVRFCEEKVAGGTNAVNGFTLSVVDKEGSTSLENEDGSGTATSEIAATDDEVFTGSVSEPVWAAAGWNLTGGNLEHTGITTDEQIVVRTNAAKDYQTTVRYNIATSENQEIGEYSDIITYTIAANESAVSELGTE